MRVLVLVLLTLAAPSLVPGCHRYLAVNWTRFWRVFIREGAPPSKRARALALFLVLEHHHQQPSGPGTFHPITLTTLLQRV